VGPGYHPVVTASARWTVPWRGRRQRLSVVVPVYNVESMLAASLDSVLAQPVKDLEVVIVDDGSTDGSLAVARGYADGDPRVRLIVQENGGVSRARNVGLDHCTGDLVTFVDPDDILPADAWRPLLRALERTGSDFAVGTMERVDAKGRRSEPPLLKRNHAQERLCVTIDDVPLMIADVFPCNKVFRMDFWRGQRLAFPVDLRYEDQVIITQAFLVASSFDVLTNKVYEWHTRVDQSSATQARGRYQNLSDRMVTKQMTVDLVGGHGDPLLWDTLHRVVLPVDMWEHFRAAVAPTTVDRDRYWAALRAGLMDIWKDDTVPFECTAVPVAQRLMGWLVGQDRQDDLARLVAQIDGPGVPVEEGRYLHPWIDEPGVPGVLSCVRTPSA
jgi:hypothetical protein